MKTNTTDNPGALAGRAPGWTALAREYYQLTKPRVVGLIIFTAVVGMFLSTPGMVPVSTLLLGTLGIGLAAASGAAMNHILDRDADSVMKRTRHRPLPTGHLNAIQAMIFACMLSMASMLQGLMDTEVIQRTDPEALARLIQGGLMDASFWIAEADNPPQRLAAALDSLGLMLRGLLRVPEPR